MFGDTEATTTTFWGEKCLNCIAPPALQPGVVAVTQSTEFGTCYSLDELRATLGLLRAEGDAAPGDPRAPVEAP